MSRLNLWGRPWAVFDPDNKQHRRWFNQFQTTHTWGHCPVRFVVPADHGDLVTMIQRQLVNYYVNKEFKQSNESKTAKAQRKPRKKYLPA
jgi:hypothetical protein